MISYPLTWNLILQCERTDIITGFMLCGFDLCDKIVSKPLTNAMNLSFARIYIMKFSFLWMNSQYQLIHHCPNKVCKWAKVLVLPTRFATLAIKFVLLKACGVYLCNFTDFGPHIVNYYIKHVVFLELRTARFSLP